MTSLFEFLNLVAFAALLSVRRATDCRVRWNPAQFLLTLSLCVFGFWMGGAA